MSTSAGEPLTSSGGEAIISNAPLRKPSWFSKLTKRQILTTSLTTPAETDIFNERFSQSCRPASNLEVINNSTSQIDNEIEKQIKPETLVDACRCCGTLITYPSNAAKIKCSVCHIVVVLNTQDIPQKIGNDKDRPELSYAQLKRVINDCKNSNGPNSSSRLKPLEHYLNITFGSFDILNSSFRRPGSKLLSTSSSGIDYHEVKKFYTLLLKIPGHRPYQALLSSANSLLSRPVKFSEPDEIYWILILLEIPSLHSCVIQSSKAFSREVNTISYEILKRIIGILGYSEPKVKHYLCRWFAKLSREEFSDKINLANLYINFRLNRCISSEILRKNMSSKAMSPHVTNEIDRPDYKDANEIVTTPRYWGFGNINAASTKGDKIIKIKLSQYGNDWHLRSAGRILGVLFSSNVYYRVDRLPLSNFYNTLVDYVNVRQDFDAWQYNCGSQQRRCSETTSDGEPSLEYVVAYLQDITTTSLFGIGSPMSPLSTKMKPTFTFCQYPFTISLGSKISILEYEARKQMERKAEEAFISSLHKKMPIDVYFRLRVRRTHISHDSLRGILQHQADLKKSLRVEFVNEPGIDAGGLKKEWFMLLSKELFNPINGLFTYNSESHLGWFSFSSIDNNEMYYLVGVILGLAIYNSTILDLQFPQVLYKKLLGKSKVHLDDYTELYPVSGSNLKKLLQYNKKFDFDGLELYFEATYEDLFGIIQTMELMPNGSQTKVTLENRAEYVRRYTNFFLNEVVAEQCKSFKKGFDNVIGGNALSLFDSQEIELILIGDDSGDGDKFLDVSVLRVITKYQGGLTEESDIVQWFWEYAESLSKKEQKLLLLFITGSDRLPATGVQALTFKITLLKGSASRLPIAHTCFNEICFYQYPSRDHLWNKLEMALHESEGFGIK